MKNISRAKRTVASVVTRLTALTLLAFAVAGCRPHGPTRYQGYLEGEFVYIAAPLPGQLETLAVAKGARVAAGAPLFTLERSAELAAQRQAADQLHAAQARLDDLRKGSRPSELAALEARLGQVQAAAELARIERDRQAELFRTHVVAENDYDRARLSYDQAAHTVGELSAQLETAKLGGRADAITAAEADVAAAEAAKTRADWNVDQKAQAAPRAGLVFDTLFRPGEYVAAAQPVVTLLPPENVKVRFFVPEADVAALQPGQIVPVTISGRPPLSATISYVSPQPEFTPPVLYNREGRTKLVFMIEATFAPAVAAELHPGQPVDVAPPR
jgi:HlyD family secretion protein